SRSGLQVLARCTFVCRLTAFRVRRTLWPFRRRAGWPPLLVSGRVAWPSSGCPSSCGLAGCRSGLIPPARPPGCRSLFSFPLAGGLDALLKGLHQIDHAGRFARTGGPGLDLLAFGLAFEQVFNALAVFVVILLRLEGVDQS